MDIKIIIIIGFSYLYGFFEVFMNLRQKGKRNVKTSGDKGSLWLLYILITIGYALSFAIGATKIGRMSHWDAFLCSWSRIDCNGITDQNTVHLDP